jgi:hypothetical protein
MNKATFQNRYAKITHVVLGWNTKNEQWDYCGMGESADAACHDSSNRSGESCDHFILVGPSGTFQMEECYDCGASKLMPHQSAEVPLCAECAIKRAKMEK